MVEAVRVALTSSRSQAECLKLLGYASKMGAGVGVAPTSPGLMRPGGTTGSTRNGKLARPAGVAPDRLDSEAGQFAGTTDMGLDTMAGLAPANLGFAGRSLGCAGTSWKNLNRGSGRSASEDFSYVRPQ